MQSLIQSYLDALQQSDYEQIILLFSENAVVLSPLYGRCNVLDFYKDLFSDTRQSEITLLDVFKDTSNRKIAANFLYSWTLADGSITTFDCVDIFELDEYSKIKLLKIIYDTTKVRPIFEGLKMKD